MTQLLAIIQFISIVAPALGKIYDAVAAALPADSPGAAKMAAFKAMLSQLVATEQAIAPAFESAWPVVQTLIEAIHAQKKTA